MRVAEIVQADAAWTVFGGLLGGCRGFSRTRPLLRLPFSAIALLREGPTAASISKVQSQRVGPVSLPESSTPPAFGCRQCVG